MQHYQVETRMLGGWENVFQEDDQLVTFTSEAAAQASIDELLEDTQLAYEAGHFDEPYSRDDYRVAPAPLPCDHIWMRALDEARYDQCNTCGAIRSPGNPYQEALTAEFKARDALSRGS